jgi:hypothetical protein
MAQTYDRFRNTVRPSERLILRTGDSFPSGAVASEWKKNATVDESELTDLEKADLSKNGYAYSKMSMTFTINEGVTPPTKKPGKK